jgi:hypothetical protein
MSDDTRPYLLITDRNRHIRALICRELIGLGLVVRSCSSEVEMAGYLTSSTPPRFVILDLDIFIVYSEEIIIDQLIKRYRETTFIIHGFRDQLPAWTLCGEKIHFINKDGASIDRIRQLIDQKLDYRNASSIDDSWGW